MTYRRQLRTDSPQCSLVARQNSACAPGPTNVSQFLTGLSGPSRLVRSYIDRDRFGQLGTADRLIKPTARRSILEFHCGSFVPDDTGQSVRGQKPRAACALRTKRPWSRAWYQLAASCLGPTHRTHLRLSPNARRCANRGNS
jgi:hypothetical protein